VLKIYSTELLSNTSNLINPKDITIIENQKDHTTNSVVMPYKIYEVLKENIDIELEKINIKNKKLESIKSLKSFNLGGKNYSEIKSEKL
jgi:hypothetical protein